MFDRHRLAGQEQLQYRSGTLQEDLGQIDWQDEQVYRTPAHNAMSSRVIVDKLTPLLPKDIEEVALQVNLR
jgi:hypothetical protein